MLARDVEATDVVQAAVVGLADERVHGPDVLVAGLGERPADDRVDGDADPERVGQNDRRFDGAELLHLRRSGELAEGVADKDRAGHLLTKEIPGVRKDRGHACPHGVSRHQSRVSDAHASDIRDGVERPRAAGAGLDAEVTRARTALGGDVDARNAPDECHHRQAADILVRVSSRAIQM